MKHRSVIAFVLLAAILAAVPQASQDLLELKSALGERVRSEFWQAVLNLNERGGASQSAPRRAPQHALASCNAPASPGSKKSSAPARAASAHAEAASSAGAVKRVEIEELAMMLTPPADIEEKIGLEVAEDLRGLVIGKVLKAPSRAPLPREERAMIIPPSEGADPVIPRRLEAAARAKAARADSRLAGLESRVSYVAAAFDERGVEFNKKSGELLRFQFNSLLKDGVAIPLPAPAPKGKVTKVGRQRTTTSATAPVAAVSKGQAKHLACLGTELGEADALAATE
jgi:hypothetical protein